MHLTQKDISRQLMDNIKSIPGIDTAEKRGELARDCDVFTSLCLLAQSYYTSLEVEKEAVKDKYKSLINFVIPFSSLWEDQEGNEGENAKDLERLNPVIDAIDNYLLSLGRGKEEYKLLLLTSAMNHFYKRQANKLHQVALAIVDEKEKRHLAGFAGNRKQRKKAEKETKIFYKEKKQRMTNKKNNRLKMFDKSAKFTDKNLVTFINNNVAKLLEYNEED